MEEHVSARPRSPHAPSELSLGLDSTGSDALNLRFFDFSPRHRGIERIDIPDAELLAARDRLEREGFLPKRVPLADVKVERSGLTDARHFIRNQLKAWDRALHGSPFQISGRELGGSLATGTFWGPKDARLAESSFCPPHINRIIECDLHYYLAPGLNPHSEAIIQYFEETLRAQRVPEAEFVTNWGIRLPIQRLFLYSEINPQTAIEFEVTLTEADKIPEISNFWRRVFTPQEITWQSELRAALRAWSVESDTMWQEKTHQCVECEWRIVSGYALKQLLAEERLRMREAADQTALVRAINSSFKGEAHPLISERVQEWLHGQGGKGGLHRPQDLMSPGARNYVEVFFPEKLNAAVSPFWVEVADSIQREIQSRVRGDASFIGPCPPPSMDRPASNDRVG